MNVAEGRIAAGLGIRHKTARFVAASALLVVAVTIIVATRLNMLPQVAGMLLGLVAVLISFQWPLLPLFAFAILVPIEEAIVLGELGTLSRYMELLFIVAYGLPRIGRLTISAMPLSGWGFVAWAALSLGWAIAPADTLARLPVLFLLFATAVVIASAVAERPSIVRPLLWAYSLSAGVTAVLGIAGFVSGNLGVADRSTAFDGQDPAHYAALLLPALVFSLNELFHGRLLILSGGVAFVCLTGVIVSGTRGAWLSVLVVIALYVFPRLGALHRVAALALVTGLVVLALQLPGVASLVTERTGTALTSGGAGRTDIWLVGLLIYASAPITGVGAGDFPAAYTPERIRQSEVTVIAPWRPAFRAPHNLIIGTLGELGTVGLILLALFLGPLLIRPGWGPEAVVVQAALASLVTMALFLDLLNRKETWLVIGLACGLAYLGGRERLRAGSVATGRLTRAFGRQATALAMRLPAWLAPPTPTGDRSGRERSGSDATAQRGSP